MSSEGLAKWTWAELNNTVHSLNVYPAVYTQLYNTALAYF
jgi:hypothetical protein